MLIPVIYPNGKHDLVKDFLLSVLIDKQGITKFKRSSGWVNITIDNIRIPKSMSFYRGKERRLTESATAEPIDIF